MRKTKNIFIKGWRAATPTSQWLYLNGGGWSNLATT